MEQKNGTPPGATTLNFSPFDQIAPRLYVHKFFCFEFPNPELQAQAVQHLEECLSAAILRWPFITGEVGPIESGTNDDVFQELRYTETVVGEVERKILIVKNLTHEEFPHKYQDLAAKHMPPHVFKIETLASVPEWPDATKTWPALSIQANFIEGGLILCFAFHHCVADGGSFITFIKQFGAGLKNPPRVDSGVDKIAHKRLPYTPSKPGQLKRLDSFPQYAAANAPVRPPPGPCTTKILQFSAAKVRALEAAVNQHLKATIEPEAYATNIGCLSSLIWVASVRARRDRLSPTEEVKMGVAVNVRAVTDPPLPKDYFGNAFLHTTATATVDELLGSEIDFRTDSIVSSIPIAAVALAAWRMRQAVKLDNKFVMDRLRTFSSLSDPGQVFKAYDRVMDNSTTGIDFSSWRDQGANIEFGIPGTTTSSVNFWRKAYSPNVGAYNILPRKGGSKGEDVWEVSLGLSVEDMDRACAEEELGGWLLRVLE